MQDKGLIIEVKKVKAHTDDDSLAPLALRLDNQFADHFAGDSVIEVPASEVASIHWKDRKQRASQE